MLLTISTAVAALASLAIAQTTTYQAEDATLTGVEVATEVTGYTGKYFVSLDCDVAANLRSIKVRDTLVALILRAMKSSSPSPAPLKGCMT